MIGIVATLGANVSRCFAAFGDDVANTALRHDLYHTDRDMAFERMHADLEALPTTSD